MVSAEISTTRVLKGSLILGVGLFSAQVAGFIRQLVTGYLLGTGMEADALTAAMAPIEMWWSVLATALIFGLAPMFSPRDGREASAFDDVLKPVARLAIASTVLCWVSARPLIYVFAPGLDAETAALAVRLLHIFSLSLAAISIGFVYTALLFSRRRFAVASFQHTIVNVSTIIAALLLYDRLGVHSFAVGFVGGAWVQLGVNYLHARRTIRDRGPASGSLRLRDLLASPAPILAHAFAMELNTAVTRAYASTFGLGMTAAFEFGFKVVRVPMALLVIPLSQALLPEVASQPGRDAGRRESLRAVTRATWPLLGCLAATTVAMLIARTPMVSLLFERGAFGRASTEAVSVILLGYTAVIVGRGLSDFLSRALFAMSLFRVALVTITLAVAINIGVCVLLPPTQPELIGLGATLGFTLAAVWIAGHVFRLQRHA